MYTPINNKETNKDKIKKFKKLSNYIENKCRECYILIYENIPRDNKMRSLKTIKNDHLNIFQNKYNKYIIYKHDTKNLQFSIENYYLFDRGIIKLVDDDKITQYRLYVEMKRGFYTSDKSNPCTLTNYIKEVFNDEYKIFDDWNMIDDDKEIGSDEDNDSIPYDDDSSDYNNDYNT